MSPDLRTRAVDWTARHLRRLPVLVTRILLLIDVTLSIVPFWGFFAYRRCTGRRVSITEFRPISARGIRFVAAHAGHSGQGTGPLSMSWFAPPVRRAPLAEVRDHSTPGSCGSCTNCCTTHWMG